MATLYVTEPGARLEKEYKRLRIVDKEGKTILVTPLSRVSEVVIVGWCGATTPAMLALLDAGIGLTFATRQGKLRGKLTPAIGKNVPLRQLQYQQAGNADFELNLSRALICGKLKNSRTIARRVIRGGAHPPAGQVSRLTTALKAVPMCRTLNQVMSQEGNGAKAYFSILRSGMKAELAFGPRSRRPPKDPVNALLSLGYSLLTSNVMTALEIVGLDPYCGYLHATTYGRPALALDLMEEFRPVIVDSVVLTLVNKRILTQNDFETGEGTWLTRQGLKRYFQQYTRRLNTTVIHPLAGRPLSYQKILEVQARQIAKLIQGQIDVYQPFLIR